MKSPLECKKLSRDISSFNYKRWMENAKDLCQNGIEAKFVQNPRIMQALLETGNQKLVECTKDYLWGTGVPLNDPQCLTAKCWKGQGLQGIVTRNTTETHANSSSSPSHYQSMALTGPTTTTPAWTSTL